MRGNGNGDCREVEEKREKRSAIRKPSPAALATVGDGHGDCWEAGGKKGEEDRGREIREKSTRNRSNARKENKRKSSMGVGMSPTRLRVKTKRQNQTLPNNVCSVHTYNQTGKETISPTRLIRQGIRFGHVVD